MADINIVALASEGARNKWHRDPGLQAEFSSADAYAGFVIAAGTGNVAAVGDGWEREWRGTPALQHEFSSAKSYAAFRRYQVQRKR